MILIKRVLISSFLLTAILITAASFVSAQVRPPLPRPSQKASVMQSLGTTDITITYSRPMVKGRTIFAEPTAAMAARAKGEASLDDQNERLPGEPIVPYGHLWRAGANEATLFVVTDDVLVNGQPLAAGKYSFHMIPGKDEWTVIFNKDDGQWGSFAYDAKKDALRIKTKSETTPEISELLTFGITPVTETSARVSLRWEKVKVPFTVEVKDVVGSTMTRLKAYVAAAKPDDAGPLINAAIFAKANKQTEAAQWFEQALRINDDQIKAKATFQNLSRRSTILLQLGRMQDALAAAETALIQGKAEKANTSGLEKRIADIKAGKL